MELNGQTNETLKGSLTKLGISVNNLKITPKMSETSFTNPLKEGTWENMFDGDFTTHAWTNQGQNNGGYIIIDLGTSTPLYDVTIVTADGKPHLYDADIQISSDKKEWTTIASVKNDNTKVEPPYRYVRANAQGAKSRYLRILVTDDVIGKYDNPFLCIKEIEFNKNIEENTSTYPIASSAEGNLEKCIDQDLSTVFTTENKTAGWLEYKLTDNTKLKSFSILQDVHTISEANVKVRTGTDKWKDLGTFDKGTKTFDVSEYDNIFAIRLEWAEGKAPSIYEIYTNEDEKQNTDDIGIYVEQIIDTEADSEKPKPEQPEIPDSENLAINRPVEVSGTELDRDQKDFAVDGNRETRWNSNYIKGDHASEEAWIIVDLGEETNIIESLTAEYFNLVYPTDYDVLVSADKENWITAKTIKNEPNGAAHPTDEISLDQPIIGRYVKLLFRELNSAAVGNCVGLEELTITGKRISSETELKEYMPISDIKIDKGTSQEELRKLLPLIISGKLALKDSDKILDLASLFVNWDLSEYTSAEDTILTLKGNLIGAGKATGDEISLNVIIGTGSTEPPVDPEGPTDPDTPDSGKIEQLKQELALLIETAQAKVESGKYTDETVKILKEQIIKSEALLTDNVTAEQLEQQINSIKKSINGLTEKKADLETSDRPNQNITHSEKSTAVKTGDSTHIIPLFLLMICTGFSLILFRKRNTYNK